MLCDSAANVFAPAWFVLENIVPSEGNIRVKTATKCFGSESLPVLWSECVELRNRRSGMAGVHFAGILAGLGISRTKICDGNPEQTAGERTKSP